MRAPHIIVTLALAALHHAAQATDVVTVPLTPDRRIEEHIAAIDGLDRTLAVVVIGGAQPQSRQQQVMVRGPISAQSVEVIVRSALATEKGYWSSVGVWEVHVIGDAEYASVTIATYCGELCGGGATFTYSFTNGQWTYLYTSNRWIS
jgi:hypothetical protein